MTAKEIQQKRTAGIHWRGEEISTSGCGKSPEGNYCTMEQVRSMCGEG